MRHGLVMRADHHQLLAGPTYRSAVASEAPPSKLDFTLKRSLLDATAASFQLRQFCAHRIRRDPVSELNVLQLVRVSGQVNGDDLAVAVFDGHGVDGPVALARHKSGEPLTIAARAVMAARAGENAVFCPSRMGLRAAARLPPLADIRLASCSRRLHAVRAKPRHESQDSDRVP